MHDAEVVGQAADGDVGVLLGRPGEPGQAARDDGGELLALAPLETSVALLSGRGERAEEGEDEREERGELA